MNEMKPEDVMKALECCADCGCYECPYVPPRDCHKGTMGCSEQMLKHALALLREKDADINGLEADNEHLTLVIEGKMKQISRMAQKIVDKDAEIERLTINMNAYGLTAKNLAKEFADVQMEIATARAEAITEFAERLKEYARACRDSGYDGIGENDIDQIAKEMKGENE